MNEYKALLQQKADMYVKSAYKYSMDFPKHEIYGITSQFRRSCLSVVLNIIEGYARFRPLVYKNFLEISFGSLQESKYLIGLANSLGYIDMDGFKELNQKADEIGKMLYHILTTERSFK